MPRYGPYQKGDGHSYALGVFPSLELMAAHPEAVRALLLAPQGARNEGVAKLVAACNRLHLPVEEAPRALARISGKENCFAALVFDKYVCQLDSAADHVVLHNPSDVGNVGTILRSCLGFGFLNVCIIRPGVDPFDPRVLRASMGAAFHLNIVAQDSFSEYMERFPGRDLYLFRLRNARPLAQVERGAGPATLAFGNEASGLPKELEQVGNGVVIPHGEQIDSLNLAVAAGIGLYALKRKGC